MKIISPHFYITLLIALLAFPGLIRAQDADDADNPGEEKKPTAVYNDPDFEEKLKAISKAKADVRESIKSMTHEVNKDPGNADLWYKLGDACASVGDFRKAISAYSKSLEIDGTRKEVWYSAGVAYRYNNDGKRAYQAFKQALQIDPAYPEVLVSVATLMIDSGRLEEAQPLVDDAQKAAPTLPMVWNVTGVLFSRHKQWNEALDAYNKALAINPDYVPGLDNRGRLHAMMKDYPAAIADFEKIIKIVPVRNDAWFGVVQSDIDAGKTDDAVRVARKSVEVNPDHAPLWQMLGKLCVYTKDTPGAIQAYEKATALDPKMEQAWLELGRLYIETKQVEKSAHSFQRVTEIDPKSSEGWMGLGYLSAATGRDEQAIALFQHAIDCNPNSENAWSNIAHVYAKQNNVAKFNETCDKIAQFNAALAAKLREEATPK